jgi:radical SAM superfamily enzyme YgiQ (UPF0313 family)
MIAPEEPFLQPVQKRWIPTEMITAPLLNASDRGAPVEPHYVLLINPFYPKDPNASFGKHVLTPSLALTSFAATTPDHWRVDYWDENLLDGPPPSRPQPQVVGITVHLTFARRAYELADWYRARGAQIVLGGLHVLSCPEECAPHADALALGDGVQLWPQILRDVEAGRLQPRYIATYENEYADDPAPPCHYATEQFLDHDQSHRHSRLSQPVRSANALPYARSEAGSRGVPRRPATVCCIH